MRLRICHTTEFSYAIPAFQSHNEIRMVPRDGYGQTVIESKLDLSVTAATVAYDDYFGNRVHAVSIHEPHDSLRIASTSLIEKVSLDTARVSPVAYETFLQGTSSRMQSEYDFMRPSRLIPFSEALRKFFETIKPGQHEDVADYTSRVITVLHQQFRYEPGATRVDSNVDEILTRSAGVCQDLAHLAIGVLRLAGVPTRYVSGYLAPGLGADDIVTVGAQASHAWLEAQLPTIGWAGFDPTHGCATDPRHVRVASGRDYSDVPPLRGIYRGNSAEQIMRVELQVIPELEADPASSGSQQ